jgi:DNA-binding Xre family transcriptional regulator
MMMGRLDNMQGRTNMAKFRAKVEELTLKKSAERGTRITQKELSEASGVPVTTLSRLNKKPAARIDADTVYSLLDYFDCTFEELFERVD